jgi:hypothetical protein
MISQHDAGGVFHILQKVQSIPGFRATVDEIADAPERVVSVGEVNFLQEFSQWLEAALNISYYVRAHACPMNFATGDSIAFTLFSTPFQSSVC